MASLPGPLSSPTSVLSTVEIISYVRGVYVYKHIWEPNEGKVLLLKRKQDNTEDKFAVAVMKNGEVVGHVPKNLAPCKFALYGPEAYLRRLKELVELLEGQLVK